MISRADIQNASILIVDDHRESLELAHATLVHEGLFPRHQHAQVLRAAQALLPAKSEAGTSLRASTASASAARIASTRTRPVIARWPRPVRRATRGRAPPHPLR